MKYLKMLGLAAIAALGLMAFVGAGTASATTLCTTTDTPDCTMSYTAGTTIHASLKAGTSAKLTNTSGSVIATCTTSTITGSTTNTSATWIEGNIAIFSWALQPECSQNTATVTLGKLKIMWIEGTHNGTVEGVETEVTVEIFGVTCTYGAGAGTHLGTLTGGSAPILSISTVVNKTAGGFLCPGTAGWDAEYVITEPHALFITT